MEPAHDITIIEDVMVAMRDGTRLATDIYLPNGCSPERRYPALLERTPYNKRGTNSADRSLVDPQPRPKPAVAAEFARAGYVYVLQDCRGRYGSEGVFTKYLNEAADGADTLAWMLHQPWSDGRVGTLGLSYGAHVQSALACLDPPGLGAMFLDSGGFASAYHNGSRQGGAFELKQLTWARKHALLSRETLADPKRRAALEAQDISEWIRGATWLRGASPLAAAPEYEDYILEQWGHDTFSSYWRQLGIYARGWYPSYADVPMVHMASWFDPYSQTAIDNFTSLAPIKHGPVKLVLGPWTHGQRSVTFAGDVDFGPQAPLDGNIAPDYVTLRRDWFDRYLLGKDVADHLASPVTIFVMGGGSGRRTPEGRLDHGGRWRNEATWPPADVTNHRYYLHADGRLDSVIPQRASTLDYLADPADPVPTIGGAIASGAPVMDAGAFDQRTTPEIFGARAPFGPLADRADVLVFETGPLATDIEVTGSVTAHLFVSSSAPDSDFTIKLIDVHPPSADYPEGYAMNLAHGILRARFRNSFEKPEPMEPDRIYGITIRAFPTSNLFLAGHRIRIDVASSNFPHFDVNPNSNWRDSTARPQIAHNYVHLGGARASHILLPIVPRRR